MNTVCEFCNRKRFNQNDTNWNRHIEACKKKFKGNKIQKEKLDCFFRKKPTIQSVIIIKINNIKLE